jgi:antitoxin component YwqK of YwqJK toxin-antitoxin module
MDPLWLDRERVDREITSIDFAALTFDNDLGVYCLQGDPFTGACAQRYSDGKLQSIIHHAVGLAHGITVVWFTNGKIHLYSEMVSDTPHGLHIEWDKDGNKVLEEHYRRGQLVV